MCPESAQDSGHNCAEKETTALDRRSGAHDHPAVLCGLDVDKVQHQGCVFAHPIARDCTGRVRYLPAPATFTNGQLAPGDAEADARGMSVISTFGFKRPDTARAVDREREALAI